MEVDNTGDKKKISKILGLRQIAWWWLPKSMAQQPDKDVWANLPGIQRGFVWNANQIERLWDSITRGFPLGSILLQDSVEADPSTQAPKSGSEVSDEPLPAACSHYLILDGQQRATSIALGFKNVWDDDSTCKSKQDDWRALWVDIHNESKPKDERQFLFKLTNQAHPWGYASEVEATAHPRRIHAQEMREAMVAYKWICTFLNGQELNELKPHEVIARVAFPWDSRAPVPVAFILELLVEKSKVSNEEIAKSLLEKISRLPFQALNNDVDSERVPSDVKEKVQEKFNNIREILENQNQDQAKQFNAVVDGLRRALAETEIPAPVLRSINPAKNNDDSGNENVNDEMDAAFNLFERINTAGTRLTREEINYSMLKSVWPDAAKKIPELLKKRWLTHPARLVSLLSRLLLTFPAVTQNKSSKEDTLRDGLNIAQFRNAIHKGSLKTQLETFCDQEGMCGATQLLESTWTLLTEDEWALPSVLAADITQHNEDLMLLLMAWRYRISLTGRNVVLTDEEKKYALGCITAIHWFALDAPLCAKLLGRDLLSCPENKLTMFFHGKLTTLLLKANSEKSVMIPLPDVAALGIILESGQSDKDDKKLNSIWDLYFDDPPDEVKAWVRCFGDENNGVNYYPLAHKFLVKVMGDRRLVLHAQSKIVDDWFGWFDPTKIERVTDHNAPWDFDHILPWSWVGDKRISSLVPKMARIWINSNGNFRAWPAEYNRSKGNHLLIEDKLLEYELGKQQDVYDASFIRCPGDWEELSALEGRDDFLGKVKDKELFEKFVKAAIHRTIDIYRDWYDTLEIGKL